MGENPDLDNGLSLGDDLYLISNRNMHISIVNFNIEHSRLSHLVEKSLRFLRFWANSAKKRAKIRPDD